FWGCDIRCRFAAVRIAGAVLMTAARDEIGRCLCVEGQQQRPQHRFRKYRPHRAVSLVQAFQFRALRSGAPHGGSWLGRARPTRKARDSLSFLDYRSSSILGRFFSTPPGSLYAALTSESGSPQVAAFPEIIQ